MLSIIERFIPGAKERRLEKASKVKEKKKENEEKEKKRKEEEKKKIDNFRNKQFIVHIRERDDRKVAFESLFLDVLLKQGATVKYLIESEVKAIIRGDTVVPIEDGALALIGTAWIKEEKRGGYEDRHSGWVSEYLADITYCDFHIISYRENMKKIQVAYAGNNPNPNNLADSAVSHIISSLPLSEE